MKNKIIWLTLSLAFASYSLFAQEKKEKITLDFGSEAVTSYIWRGISFDSSLSIQPWIAMSMGGFSVGTWGSFNTNGTYIEPDFYLRYALNNFSATLTDFHAGAGNNFFNYKKAETLHIGELLLQYTYSDIFPLKLSASVMLYGADKKLDHIDIATGDVKLSTENNYSLYFELAYNHVMQNNVSLDVFTGVVPSESNYYNVDKFACINAGIKVSKSLKINADFSLPIRLSVITNPDMGKVFYVFGISI